MEDNKFVVVHTPVEQDENPGLMPYHASENGLHPQSTAGGAWEPSPLPESWGQPSSAGWESTMMDSKNGGSSGMPSPASNAATSAAMGGEGVSAKSNRRCGMAPRTFWIVVILGVLLILGGIAGAVAGVLVSRSNNANANGSPSPDDGGGGGDGGSGSGAGALTGSRLAALDWKDSTGAARRAVFYQLDNHLFLTQRDPSTGQWTPLNISARFDDEPLTIRNGTPIAVDATPDNLNATVDFSAALYFVDGAGYVRELLSTDDTGLGSWTRGALWDVNRAVSGNSDLAATGFYCDDPLCIQERVVVFQASGGGVYLLNGTDWKADPLYLVSANTGSPLGIVTFPSLNGTSVIWEPRNSLRIFYRRGNAIVNFAFDRFLANGWWWESGDPMSGLTWDFPRAQFAAGPSNSNSAALVVAATPQGAVRASAFMSAKGKWDSDYNNKETSFQAPSGSSSNSPEGGVSAIAMSKSWLMYILHADGKTVTEWEWGNAAPFQFGQTGVVISM